MDSIRWLNASTPSWRNTSPSGCLPLLTFFHEVYVKQLVVTGTGTDLGKTVVTAGLLRSLCRAGRDAVAMKPFQTGCQRRADGTFDRPDLDRVAVVSGWTPDAGELPDLCPYAFEPACSPHLAARMAKVVPSAETVVSAARRLALRHEVVIAETAGGILVPINEHEFMLDWMAALGWPVLVVARAGLGTLNDTLLTLQALQGAGLECAGVVLNESTSAGPGFPDALEAAIRDDNVDSLRRLGNVPVLASIPWLGADLPDLDWVRFEAAFAAGILALF